MAVTKCMKCRIDRKRCQINETNSACNWCIQNHSPCILSSTPPDTDDKQSRLNRDKCDHCRRKKQKCLPEGRAWPEKCYLCLQKNLPCSAPHKSKDLRERPTPLRSRASLADSTEDQVHRDIHQLSQPQNLVPSTASHYTFEVPKSFSLKHIDDHSGVPQLTSKCNTNAHIERPQYTNCVRRLVKYTQLNTRPPATSFSLVDLRPTDTPPRYAILSHRWGLDEVTIEDLKEGVVQTKAGLRKLEFCAKQAFQDGVDYFWIDTCCIDKSNQIELSEAVNSMFDWYKRAAKCYVYMADVPKKSQKRALDVEVKWKASFKSSEWFTRGWTLQELIAPQMVEFFTANGERLGDKNSLEQEIHQATRIPISALQGHPLAGFAAENRLSWGAERNTTIEEDAVYCLLGVLGVHMPINYGEGRENAMMRLYEILHISRCEERKCHQSLKTSSYVAYKDRNPLRAPGTCQWVLQNTNFRDWLCNNDQMLLWISADPGCGKSVLCKSLIDQHLIDAQQSSVCFFFFKDNDYQNGLTTALCAVLHQLFVQQPQLLQHAMAAWYRNGSNLPCETQELWEILCLCAKDKMAAPIICIFDAIDECHETDRHQLIKRLCDMQYSKGRDDTPSSLKVLMTSRPYDSVQRWFEQITAKWPQIRLRGEDANEQLHQEINLVIEREVQSLMLEFDLSDTECRRLRQQLLQMQHRTYLWLHLAMEEVRGACRDSIFSGRLQIESLPSSVADAYERILSKIKQKDLVRRILLIIVGARRPLTIEEMSMALSSARAYEQDAQRLDEIDAFRLQDHIREQCGLFVYIQHSQLFLIHQTAKDFLLSNKMNMDVPSRQWNANLNAAQIELEMGRICVTYLDLKYHPRQTLLQHKRTRISKQDCVQETDFFRYCAEYWVSYVQDYMLEEDDKLFRKVVRLYRAEPLLRSWFKHAWQTISPYSKEPTVRVQHAVAIFGHITILDELCRLDSVDLEQRESTGRTAVHWATERSHNHLVEWLLEKGANVNARGGYYGNALQVASARGHEKVVQTLLDRGADVNAQGGYYGNALQAASERGHERVVQMLLDMGADVNAQGSFYDEEESAAYRTALQAALYRGHEKVVQILLDRGADINALGDRYGNALQVASARGNEKVVQMLLDGGADVNARGDHYGNALQAASERGHEKVVQMLLDGGADVNAQGGRYGNALQAASERGHEKVVQMLLDGGADVNAQGDSHLPWFPQSLALLIPILISDGPPMAAVLVYRQGLFAKKLLLRHFDNQEHVSELLDPDEFPSQNLVAQGLELVPEVANAKEAKIRDENSGKIIFGIGSLVGPMIILAFQILKDKGEFPELTIETKARVAYNGVANEENPIRLHQSTRDPTLGQLSVHHNAFAPANRLLFSPDGDFLASDDEMVQNISEITDGWLNQENKETGKMAPSFAYSNINHGILGLIMVQKCKKSLSEIVNEALFKPLGMTRTYLGSQPATLQAQKDHSVAQGFRMSGDGTMFFPIPSRDYEDSIMAQASAACWSCTDDLSKLYEAVISGYHEDKGLIRRQIAEEFLTPQFHKESNEANISPAGYAFEYPTPPLARASLDSAFRTPQVDSLSSCDMTGKMTKERTLIHCKGGIMDGFTSTMYLCLAEELFVTVLCNSTGVLEFTEPLARCILQELLFGSPPDIVPEIHRHLETARPQWQRLEQEDTERGAWVDDLSPFCGLFRHSTTNRWLEIRNGDAVFRQRDKLLYRVPVGAQGHRIRLFPRSRGLFIDRITSWRTLDFELQAEGTALVSIGDGGADTYIRQ